MKNNDYVIGFLERSDHSPSSSRVTGGTAYATGSEPVRLLGGGLSMRCATPRPNAWVQAASRLAAPQSLSARVDVEPDVTGVAAAVGDDPADQAAARGGASLAGIRERFREGIAAIVAR